MDNIFFDIVLPILFTIILLMVIGVGIYLLGGLFGFWVLPQ